MTATPLDSLPWPVPPCSPPTRVDFVMGPEWTAGVEAFMLQARDWLVERTQSGEMTLDLTLCTVTEADTVPYEAHQLKLHVGDMTITIEPVCRLFMSSAATGLIRMFVGPTWQSNSTYDFIRSGTGMESSWRLAGIIPSQGQRKFEGLTEEAFNKAVDTLIASH